MEIFTSSERMVLLNTNKQTNKQTKPRQDKFIYRSTMSDKVHHNRKDHKLNLYIEVTIMSDKVHHNRKNHKIENLFYKSDLKV